LHAYPITFSRKIMPFFITFCLFIFPLFHPQVENCQGETLNGLRHSYWKCFYEDGVLLQEGDYFNGAKSGEWKFYHSNGKLALKGGYKNDQEIGKWVIFNDDGEQVDIIDYGE
jgi:antitoxin component YwqK of YwqJK toxin-antitoxin module